jgi:hypothetical protein
MSTEAPVTVQVAPIPDTPFQRRLAAGHGMRLGHPLQAVHVTSDGMLWHTVRRCCGEAIPAAVGTWEDVTPAPAVPAPYLVGQHVKLLDTHPGDGGWSTAYVERIAGSEYAVRVQGHSLYWVTAAKLAPLEVSE